MVEYAFYRDVWKGEMSEQEFGAAPRGAPGPRGRDKRHVCGPKTFGEAEAQPAPPAPRGSAGTL